MGVTHPFHDGIAMLKPIHQSPSLRVESHERMWRPLVGQTWPNRSGTEALPASVSIDFAGGSCWLRQGVPMIGLIRCRNSWTPCWCSQGHVLKKACCGLRDRFQIDLHPGEAHSTGWTSICSWGGIPGEECHAARGWRCLVMAIGFPSCFATRPRRPLNADIANFFVRQGSQDAPRCSKMLQVAVWRCIVLRCFAMNF
jgi:hypothetical protein